MARWKFEGLDKYIAQLNKLEANTDEIIGKAVYEGAGIIADAARAAMQNVTTDDEYHPNGEMRDGPTTEELEALEASFGISRMRDDNGYIHVKIGFHGRNPSGLNNSGMARMIERGSSFMKKQPFITRAVNSKKKQCEEVMARTLDEEIKKLTG